MVMKKVVIVVFAAVVLLTGKAAKAQTKSVYAVTERYVGKLKGYEVQGEKLQGRTANTLEYAAYVAIDSNLKLLFITFEASGDIVWVDAENLAQEGFITVPGASSLVGIVADEANQRVYAVEGGGEKLYVYEWNGYELVPADPCYVTLTDLGSGYGMALDENTHQLYVANDTKNVHYYDADDPNWVHIGMRDVGRLTADVAVDPNNGLHNAYLYCGGSHNYLIKHDLDDPCETSVENDIGTQATGLAVDPDTGLVYVTTSNKELRVYNCSEPNFVCEYSEGTDGKIHGPGGLCVGQVSVSRYLFNGSFEYDDKIDDITGTNPYGWDVNIPTGKFKGKVDSKWPTKGIYNLTLSSQERAAFTAGDMATVSQELDLTDVNEIIFDVNLETYLSGPWDPNICTAVVLIGNDVVWDSNDLSSGGYYDRVYTVEDKYRDGALHRLSFGLRINVDVSKLFEGYITHWDYIECIGFYGCGGLLAGDINRDCYVDFKDLKIMTDLWLEEIEAENRCNLFKGDDTGDDGGTVTFRDFSVFGLDWLENSYVEESSEP